MLQHQRKKMIFEIFKIEEDPKYYNHLLNALKLDTISMDKSEFIFGDIPVLLNKNLNNEEIQDYMWIHEWLEQFISTSKHKMGYKYWNDVDIIERYLEAMNI